MANLDGVEVDEDSAVRVLERLAVALSLTVMEAPRAHSVGSAVVAILLLGESHASVHSGPDGTFVDVFSCVRFDTGIAAETVRAVLNPQRMETTLLERRINDDAGAS